LNSSSAKAPPMSRALVVFFRGSRAEGGPVGYNRLRSVSTPLVRAAGRRPGLFSFLPAAAARSSATVAAPGHAPARHPPPSEGLVKAVAPRDALRSRIPIATPEPRGGSSGGGAGGGWTLERRVGSRIPTARDARRGWTRERRGRYAGGAGTAVSVPARGPAGLRSAPRVAFWYGR